MLPCVRFVRSAVGKATETALNFPNELAADQMTAEAYLQRGISSVKAAVGKESQEVTELPGAEGAGVL